MTKEKQIDTVATSISFFRSTEIWPVKRGVFRDHYFFPYVTNIRGADFVQPVQVESQDEARTSQASSQRKRNGNTTLLVHV